MYLVFIGNNLLFTQALSWGDDFELVMEEKEGISERTASSLDAFQSNRLCLGSVLKSSPPASSSLWDSLAELTRPFSSLLTSGNLQFWVPSGILYATIQ